MICIDVEGNTAISNSTRPQNPQQQQQRPKAHTHDIRMRNFFEHLDNTVFSLDLDFFRTLVSCSTLKRESPPPPPPPLHPPSHFLVYVCMPL